MESETTAIALAKNDTAATVHAGSPKERRKRAGVPLIKAAAYANVSEHTARVYEIDPESVSPAKRAALDSFYASLQSARISAAPHAA